MQPELAKTRLDDALAKVDELIAALRSGTLLGGAPAPASKPAAAAAAPAPASKPAGAAPAAGGKQAKKEKKAAAGGGGGAPAAAEDAFDKAQLAVGRVTSVQEHPSGSEKLWLCKVDIGSGSERQVVAGLRQHISREELTARLVALVLNLKPAKLAGELSEAMILAADHQLEGGAVLVRVLAVPDGCQPGDAIHHEGGSAPAAYPKECKSKAWKEVVEGLAVAGGIARFKGTPLVAGARPLTVAADMPDGAGIH